MATERKNVRFRPKADMTARRRLTVFPDSPAAHVDRTRRFAELARLSRTGTDLACIQSGGSA
jgi:hypothetical protein